MSSGTTIIFFCFGDRYSQLTTLSLRGTGLNDASVLELCDGLHAARQLQRLDLSHNYITGTGLDVLVDAMTQVSCGGE